MLKSRQCLILLWVGILVHCVLAPYLFGGEMIVVQVGDPVLRQPARELSREEILSPEIQRLIEDMLAMMRAAPGVGMAAPQIGQSVQLIVIEDMNHSHLTAAELLERERRPVPYHVVINPRLHIDATETACFFEGCLSVPALMGAVPRAKSVRVECLNEKAEPVVIEAKGWYARILQHEIDHLHGILFIDRVLVPTLMTMDNYQKFWRGKPAQEAINLLLSR
jgi:peptide deformylase